MPWSPGSSEAGDFLLGVDLGQARGHTTIVLVERKDVEITSRKLLEAFRNEHGGLAYAQAVVVRQYQIRYVERLPLSTSYVAIVERVRRVLAGLGSRATLIVDGTGVGRAVVDFFEAAGTIRCSPRA